MDVFARGDEPLPLAMFHPGSELFAPAFRIPVVEVDLAIYDPNITIKGDERMQGVEQLGQVGWHEVARDDVPPTQFIVELVTVLDVTISQSCAHMSSF